MPGVYVTCLVLAAEVAESLVPAEATAPAPSRIAAAPADREPIGVARERAGEELEEAGPVAARYDREAGDPAPHARVLAVDDDPCVARVMRAWLEDLPAAIVVETDPAAALDRVVRGERFDVIVSDLVMPGLSGMDLHAAIAGLDAAQASRMVFVTGSAHMPRARAFLEQPGRIWLDKPFDPVDLRALVASRLAVAAPGAEPSGTPPATAETLARG